MFTFPRLLLFISGYSPPDLTDEDKEQLKTDAISFCGTVDLFKLPAFVNDGNDIVFINSSPREEISGSGSRRNGRETDLWMIDSAGNNLTRLTNIKDVENFGYDPVSGKIAFTGYENGSTSVYVLPDTSSQPVKLPGPLTHMYFSSWSPDGTRIVVSGINMSEYSSSTHKADGVKVPGHTGKYCRLYIMNEDGSNPREIALSYFVGRTIIAETSWSPDGKEFVFPLYTTEESGLAIANADTGETRMITEYYMPRSGYPGIGDYYPAWSPNGDLIAFVREGDIWTIRPDGTGEQEILSDGDAGDISWNPDGTRLAYLNGSYVGIIDPDGSNPARIANYQLGPVSWSPDGGKITYAPELGRRIRILKLTPLVLEINEFKT